MRTTAALIAAATLTGSALATAQAIEGPVRERAPISVHVDPTEADLTADERTRLLRTWLTCTECTTLRTRQLARFGDLLVDDLRLAYTGDDEFLQIQRARRRLAASYERMAPYLTLPNSQDAFVDREAAKIEAMARARAESLLLAIGSPRALRVLDQPRRLP